MDALRQENAKVKEKGWRGGIRKSATKHRPNTENHTSRTQDYKESGYNNTLHARGTTNKSTVFGGSHRHPFVDGIMETPLPSNRKSLTVDQYDGSTDLDKHINI